MDYVRLDPRRHRKPKSLRVGWRAMRVYEALLDISAIYDLGGFIPTDYADAAFIVSETNLKPEDWGLDPITGDEDLEDAMLDCLVALCKEGLLLENKASSGGYSIRGWEEFYGFKKQASLEPQKVKPSKTVGLQVGTEGETQESEFSPTPHTPQTDKGEKFRPADLAAIWNEWAPSRGLSKVTKLAGKRLVLAEARCKEGDAEHWRTVLARIASCPGLLGKNDRGWTVTFDWLVEPMSSAKVLEGKYDRWGQSSAKANVLDTSRAESLYGPGAA